MEDNDPDRLAVELPKNFIDKLREGKDKAAAVTFTYDADVLYNLTDDKNALKSALDQISYWGGTDGTTGIKAALDILDTSNAAYKYIIFLTDGADNYWTQYSYSNLIQRAKDNSVIIYTIGMGSAVETTLRNIASSTGGAYYKASTGTSSEEVLNLEEVYKKIEDEAIDMTTDSNNDGITDYYTKLLDNGELTINGVALFNGVLSMYSPDNDDWDEDGLKNGEELVISSDAYGNIYIDMKSNPLFVDTDSDGYSDYRETMEMQTSPLKYTILPGDINALREDYRFPKEYRNLSVPDKDNILKNAIKIFAIDKTKQSKEAFINYFYDYTTSTDVLSRDADAGSRRARNQDLADGIHLASSALEFCGSVIDTLDTLHGGEYSDMTKQRAKEAKEDTEKIMSKMLRSKKKDIDELNSPWRNMAEGIRKGRIDYLKHKAEVSSLREERQSLLESIESVYSFVNDISEAENGTQSWNIVFQRLTTVTTLLNQTIKAMATLNQIELPCEWINWFSKTLGNSEIRRGQVLSGVITVAFEALNTWAECTEITATYGKIEANYAAYQKYLELLRTIEKDNKYPDYVRNGAAEISGMFKAGGDPDWDEFDSRLNAAIGWEVAKGTFTTIINLARAVPIVGQVMLINDMAKLGINILGLADLANTMVKAEIYYSIADGSRTLFNKTTRMINGYFESINDIYSGEEAGKYALQLAQSRIVGLDAVKEFLIHGKILGWVNRFINLLFNDRTKEAIENEYIAAINDLYEVAKKCELKLSDNLPYYNEYVNGNSGGGGRSW
ncbi:MAG: VWA domain-containing protein [Synergistaceae bacterium]|nr:VWA domain-containing protein [Synergistaceae bacterium]